MSKTCTVPTTNLAEPVRLTQLAAQLEKNTTSVALAIGSSSTWGAGSSSRALAYPAQLEAFLGKLWPRENIRVVNHGVSGELASVTAARMLKLAARLKPDVVLWQVGTNDAVTRVPISNFRHTVLSAVRHLRRARIDVVLVGLQYSVKWAKDAHYGAIRKTLLSIARQEKLLLVRRYSAMRFLIQENKTLRLMAPDQFHLNDLGYQCMAEHIAYALSANLFSSR